MSWTEAIFCFVAPYVVTRLSTISRHRNKPLGLTCFGVATRCNKWRSQPAPKTTCPSGDWWQTALVYGFTREPKNLNVISLIQAKAVTKGFMIDPTTCMCPLGSHTCAMKHLLVPSSWYGSTNINASHMKMENKKHSRKHKSCDLPKFFKERSSPDIHQGPTPNQGTNAMSIAHHPNRPRRRMVSAGFGCLLGERGVSAARLLGCWCFCFFFLSCFLLITLF